MCTGGSEFSRTTCRFGASCLGTDPTHTPDWLVQGFVDAFHDHGIETGINTPYAGTLVPEQYLEDWRVAGRRNAGDGKVMFFIGLPSHPAYSGPRQERLSHQLGKN